MDKRRTTRGKALKINDLKRVNPMIGNQRARSTLAPVATVTLPPGGIAGCARARAGLWKRARALPPEGVLRHVQGLASILCQPAEKPRFVVVGCRVSGVAFVGLPGLWGRA